MAISNIGPDMLEWLDAKLAAGTMSQAEYDAKRTETLELIRTGKAVDRTGVHRFTKPVGVALLGILAAFCLFAIPVSSAPLFMFALGTTFTVAAVLDARRP